MGKRGPKPRFYEVACPNRECKLFGISGKGNVTGNGTYMTNSGRVRKYICHSCSKVFCDRTNTAFYDLRTSEDKIRLALEMVTKGMSIRGTADVLKSKILAYHSNNNTIKDNRAMTNGNYGISIFENSYNNSISGNIVVRNREKGISIDGSENAINGNNLSENKKGITITSFSRNNTVTGNNVSRSEAGIMLMLSRGNKLFGNSVRNNAKGIYLEDTYNNTFICNVMQDNEIGISINGSSNNLIYLNKFIDNVESASSNNSANLWNSTEPLHYAYKDKNFMNYLGNYWSDYDRSEINSDGIGNMPRRIDAKNADCYPLIPYLRCDDCPMAMLHTT